MSKNPINMNKPSALCLMEPQMFEDLFSEEDKARLNSMLDFSESPLAPIDFVNSERFFNDVEVIVSTWGLPPMDDAFLKRFPDLKILLYTAGSVKEKVTSESWDRPVRVVTAAAANAVPVAEFAFAQIILGLKNVWSAAALTRREQAFVAAPTPAAGTFHSTVALLGLGHIGQMVASRLKSLSVNVLAYDSCIEESVAADLGVQLCSMEDAFRSADVVSCHLPFLPVTSKVIRRQHFMSMRPQAVFLNTARGEVLDEGELFDALQERPDVTAVLDVLQSEAPGSTSPLFALPNAVITPHIAGSLGREWQRLGATIVDEAERYVSGQTLLHELTLEKSKTSA
ncbi:hypothetical protein MLD52_13135 [Puniceicoccaceae bacterium K14]|nr:hypothetical protein [Puniceicoccaceae bacterium K14]